MGKPTSFPPKRGSHPTGPPANGWVMEKLRSSKRNKRTPRRRLSEAERLCCALHPGDNVQFNERVIHAGAGAEFEPITDFFPEGVQSIRRAEAMSAALRVFATRDVTPL